MSEFKVGDLVKVNHMGTAIWEIKAIFSLKEEALLYHGQCRLNAPLKLLKLSALNKPTQQSPLPEFHIDTSGYDPHGSAALRDAYVRDLLEKVSIAMKGSK